MFLNLKYSGYNRHGEQSSAGLFLILMQPHYESVRYPHQSRFCRQCGMIREEHNRPAVPSCPDHGIVARLRAIGEAKRNSDESLVQEILSSEKYAEGCAACEAQKAYAAQCNTFQPAPIAYPLRAIVRYVRMRQLGHFMMGSARIGKERIVLSGAYGSDGLPKSVTDETYEAGTPLPQDLYEAWNKGGGWNGPGTEREAMQRWAKQTLLERKPKENDRHRRERKFLDKNRRHATRQQLKQSIGEE